MMMTKSHAQKSRINTMRTENLAPKTSQKNVTMKTVTKSQDIDPRPKKSVIAHPNTKMMTMKRVNQSIDQKIVKIMMTEKNPIPNHRNTTSQTKKTHGTGPKMTKNHGLSKDPNTGMKNTKKMRKMTEKRS